MAAVGLARESSAVAEKELAYDYQMERLEGYGCKWVYGDRISGTRDDRQGLAQALEKIKTGEADELVVTHLTRLGRSVLTINKVIELLKKHGARLTVLGGAIDISTPEGRSFLQIQAVWGQYEAELGAERSRIGWENSQRKARPRAPVFGYLIHNGQYVPDDKERSDTDGRTWSNWSVALAILAKIEELRSVNATHRWINQEWAFLQQQPRQQRPPFTYRGLRIWMGNPALVGDLVFKSGVRHPDQHLALLGREEQQRMLDLNLERKLPGVRVGDRRYAYSGLVYCALCGKKMTKATTGKRLEDGSPAYLYYICPDVRARRCTNTKRIRDRHIDKVVMNAICQESEAIAGRLAAATAEASTKIDPRIMQLQQEIDQLMPVAGLDPRIAETIADKERAIVNIQNEAPIMKTEQMENLLAAMWAIQDPAVWQSYNGREKGDRLRLVVRRIVVREGLVESVEFLPRVYP